MSNIKHGTNVQTVRLLIPMSTCKKNVVRMHYYPISDIHDLHLTDCGRVNIDNDMCK